MQTPISVSVLFTDLVGSTELSSRLGAGDAEAVRQIHFGLLREASERCGGREVKNLGDGLMVSFPGVGAALDAAIAMQQGIDRHNRTGGEPLGIRIGVATGDAVEEDGDLFGEPVVQAARLCNAADGGAILAPEVVRFLAPRGAHEFRPVGDLELKGLPDPVATLEVLWEALDEVPTREDVPLQGRLTVAHITDFVGRRRERDVLADALKAVAAGDRRAVLVAGEAGMGKTRLVTEIAQSAHSLGAMVLYGRCEEELSIPYQPWVEALGHYVAHASDQALDAHDPGRLAELSRLAPDLRVRIPELPAAVDAEPAAERHLLFTAVASVLADVAAASGCLVLVLDDLHWADQTTVHLLRHVVATLDLGSVLLLGTYRDTDLDADHPMVGSLAALHREPGVDLLALRGLDDVEVVDLLESMAGHALPEAGVALAHAVRNETDGNPFFVGEVLRHLSETGAIALQADGQWAATTELSEVGLPASVRAVVGQRIRRLGETAHKVLSVASVVGRDFDVGVVTVAAGVAEDDVLDALDAASAAGLVAEAPDVPDRFTFTHALVQHTLYEEQTGARRVRAHHRVAEALEAILGADPGDRIGELANHWLAATRPADLDKAVGYAGQAGDRAMKALAHDEAVRWYELALDAHDHRPQQDDRRRCELLLTLATAEDARSTWSGRDHFADAARAALEIGIPELAVAALTVTSPQLPYGGGDEELVALIDDALHALGPEDSIGRASLLASQACLLQYVDIEEAQRLTDDAIAVARRVGDPSSLSDAIARSQFTWLRPGRAADGFRLAGEELAFAEGAGNWARVVDIAHARFTAAIALGDARGAAAARDVLADAAPRSGVVGQRVWAPILDGCLELLRGDPARAEALADHALLLHPTDDTAISYGSQLLAIRWHQGRLGELVDLAEQFAAQHPTPVFRAVRPWLHAEAGDLDRSSELLDELRRTGFDLPRDGNWVTGTALLGLAAVLTGDVPECERRHAELGPWRDLVGCTIVSCTGPVAGVLGLLAAQLGRTDEAIAHQEVALRMARGLEAPFFVARAMVAHGRLCEDRAEVEESLVIARRHGYAGVEADARAALAAMVA